MRSLIATITANTEILPGAHLVEVLAPQLARTAQPGQYCMLCCRDALASDPLLRRPFFVASIETRADLCRFLVYRRGRGSAWLARQQPGMTLDLVGPLGHGWNIRPEVNNLLLLGEGPALAALLPLASSASERELAVTLIHCVSREEEGYPAALLSPEIEYQVLTGAPEASGLAAQLNAYLAWADLVCCAVSARVMNALVNGGNARWREKYFVQVIPERPIMCATGTCQVCQIETRHGTRLVCRDGPVIAWRDLLGDG